MEMNSVLAQVNIFIPHPLSHSLCICPSIYLPFSLLHTHIFSLYLSLTHTHTHTHLGHLILYQPPWVFKTVFDTLRMFIDPKTISKVVFIYGDDAHGSENDKIMTNIIGKYVCMCLVIL